MHLCGCCYAGRQERFGTQAGRRASLHRQACVPLARCWQLPWPVQFMGQSYFVMVMVYLHVPLSSPLMPNHHSPGAGTDPLSATNVQAATLSFKSVDSMAPDIRFDPTSCVIAVGRRLQACAGPKASPLQLLCEKVYPVPAPQKQIPRWHPSRSVDGEGDNLERLSPFQKSVDIHTESASQALE